MSDHRYRRGDYVPILGKQSDGATASRMYARAKPYPVGNSGVYGRK